MVDGEQHRFVPELESLDFISRIYWADYRFVGPDLVKILRSCMLRASIRWAVARFPNLSHDCILALRKMQEEGLDITICVPWII